MMYIKNIRLISTLAEKSFYKFQSNKLLDMSKLKILDLTIYVLIHKK